MTAKTKKIKAAGKFGAGYGTRVKKKYNKIESLQRKFQPSPFHPKARAKRISAGIWKCMKTGKIFAAPAYSLKKGLHPKYVGSAYQLTRRSRDK